MRRAGLQIAAIMLVITVAGSVSADPPQFGVEVEAGAATGFSSYLRNDVDTKADRSRKDARGRPLLNPFLVDVQTGAGTALAVRLIASNIAGGFSFRWFDLPSQTLHHRGQQAIPVGRRRPDGTVDDSGVDYTDLDPPIDEPIAEVDQNQLFIIGLGGDYRFYWPTESVDIFVPVGAEVVLTYVTRQASPYRIGLNASTGLGAAIEFVSGVSLVLNGRLHGLVTSHYGRRADAARRASAIGDGTEAAFFSTLLYGTVNLALQFQIR